VAEDHGAYAADLINLSPAALARKLKQMEDQMLEHAKNLEFEEAARVRDQMTEIKQQTFLSQA
jgi:excinuclease ABC subunit B